MTVQDLAPFPTLSHTDRQLINRLQGGLPATEAPFADVARELGLSEEAVISGVENLLGRGILSRFGPMYDAERMGGGLTLAAMRVPNEDFDRISEIVNAHPEVAHNYAREGDALNMWFVVATEDWDQVPKVLSAIESETGLDVYDMPKIDEFFIGLRFDV